MGKESAIRHKVVAALRPLGAFAVENLCGEGTPDVALTTGWIELKQVEAWPKRAATPLRVPLFTIGQRMWQRHWKATNGRGWVLIRVGEGQWHADWLLLDGVVAADHLGEVPKAELIALSVKHWHGGLNGDELLAAVR